MVKCGVYQCEEDAEAYFWNALSNHSFFRCRAHRDDGDRWVAKERMKKKELGTYILKGTLIEA